MQDQIKTYQHHIAGPAGLLELAIDYRGGATSPNLADAQNLAGTIAILCHPHSLYGGSLHDQVVSNVARACLDQGYTVIRFNFRGVGESEGKFDDGVGEIEDVHSVIDWVKTHYPDANIVLGGYSFGAATALVAASKTETKLDKLVLVAPPIQMVQSDAALSIPLLVILGGRDSIVSQTAATQYFSPQQVVVLPQADHFFSDVFRELQQHVVKFLGH